MEYLTGVILIASSLASLYCIIRIVLVKRSGKVRSIGSIELDNLPTVSICIPARNEAHALGYCLDRVVASSYERLEILVLDDNSIDDTSVLIKSFAHAGVRFIPGKQLPDGWLGKNHALHTLLDEASGDIVIFIDVDTKIDPLAIQNVVTSMQQEQFDMVSVIPMRGDIPRFSALFGTLRYFWEVVCTTSNNPMTSSSFWAVRRDSVTHAGGGFESLKSIVQPEQQFARYFSKQQKYKGYLNKADVGVYYEKRWLSQVETSQRLLTPFIRQSTSALFLPLLLTLWVLLLVLFAHQLIFSSPSIPAIASLMLAIGTYYASLTVTWSKGAIFGCLLWPYVVVQEFVLLVTSVLKYATNRVTWKGRSIQAQMQHPDYLRLDE